MIAKEINRNQFKEAIRIAFRGDNEIFHYYCPYINVESVEDIVNDISTRIATDVANANIKGVYDKNRLIGYYVYEGSNLVSFSLNVEYRTRKYLKEFWSKIRFDLKGSFGCCLWSRNIRGWKWLEKMGMRIISQDTILVHLIF